MKLNLRHPLHLCCLMWACLIHCGCSFSKQELANFSGGECPSCHTDQRLSLDMSINCSVPCHHQCLWVCVSAQATVYVCVWGEVETFCVCMCVCFHPPHHQRLYYALLLAWPTCLSKHGAVWYSTHVFPFPPHSPLLSAGSLHLRFAPELIPVNCHISSDLLSCFVNNIKTSLSVWYFKVIFVFATNHMHECVSATRSCIYQWRGLAVVEGMHIACRLFFLRFKVRVGTMCVC